MNEETPTMPEESSEGDEAPTTPPENTEPPQVEPAPLTGDEESPHEESDES